MFALISIGIFKNYRKQLNIMLLSFYKKQSTFKDPPKTESKLGMAFAIFMGKVLETDQSEWTLADTNYCFITS